ncbi:chemotaxis-specific protein-glutamate methyltransferase CheB [Paraburkholderia metrosideri]|uniref:Protein-glutamate methylesterase/protein-glutamine glutaminase n=1 Tax=Paraburkholderia metrosideri TaxID=580937 RepID=A0ABM8NHM9_9BURK|nr:chemotaxis-specific protein-glutamate methyltransferase CheB [Paraburkholderia metrosideri]CAD6526093.1 Protein-glutamate methylesterase/protein-glutamine glutaminase [Paraburkholderia metrosideri]
MIKVLIVDDSALVRKLFGGVFGNDREFEIQFAPNGLEALEQLKAFKPNVITLDVQMPGMNGLECLDRIMLEKPTPVVMVSTLTSEGAEATLDALRLGAVDFVTKPGGAVSMRMAEFAPILLEKVRAAATVKVRASARLRERIRHRANISNAIGTRVPRPKDRAPPLAPEAGEGLVVVGTSTGGPPALEALLTTLPAGFPWPIVIAQHMPASFTGALARRLDGICSISVQEVRSPTALKPGTAYIGRGDADVIVTRRAGALFAMAVPAEAGYPWHPSTNRLVRSAAEHVAPRQLVGVLMTGMGDDGAAAMVELRASGGATIAEAEETAVIWGMPGELVNRGGAEWVEPLPGIADRLMSLVPVHAANS